MDDDRQKIVEEAKKWLGTPYHHMGRVCGAGTDCGMFILQVFIDCGLIEHVEVPYYPFDIACHSDRTDYLDWVTRYCQSVDRDALPGDIIVYRFPDAKVPHHAAIVVDDEFIIHSYVRQGVVLGNRRGYKRYESGVYSYWG